MNSNTHIHLPIQNTKRRNFLIANFSLLFAVTSGIVLFGAVGILPTVVGTGGPSTASQLPAAAVIPEIATSTEQTKAVSTSPVFHYIEITNGCGPYYDTGTCVNMRSGPGLQYPIVGRLRTGVVLKVESEVVEGGLSWYKIIFDGEIRYPERVKGDWYVAVNPDSVMPIENVGDELLTAASPPTTKRIVVDLSEEMLYAYDGDTLFMQVPISAGLSATPTSVGKFTVFKKTPSRYMQGPIPEVSDQYYDLPGVPWNMYFTKDGAAIHGAYWHDHFGEPWSHGCVNLPLTQAKELYAWTDVGTRVTVQK